MAVEIEVKAQVKDRETLIRKLSSIGCELSKPTTQDDTVFTQKIGTLETFLSNTVFLRIRVQNDAKVLLTAKMPKNKSAENLIKREHEVIVSSAEEARGILMLMGYQEAVQVKKKRQKAQHGEYEICLDDIEGLGTFIEVEAFGKDEDAEDIQMKLWEFLVTLGISVDDRVKKGYDILILEKYGATPSN